MPTFAIDTRNNRTTRALRNSGMAASRQDARLDASALSSRGWRQGDPVTGAVMHLDRQCIRQGVENVLRVVELEGAGDTQLGHGRIAAQQAGTIPIEFACK